MRQRIEDLGVLAERLGNLMSDSGYTNLRMHNETFAETYKDEDKLDELYHQLRYMADEIADCWHIARYGDDDSRDLD
jgi:hypothetical protein